MIDRPHQWDLPQLDSYVEKTLRRMACNCDVMAVTRGEPVYEVVAAGRLRDGVTLRLDVEANLSGIGMPINTPLAVIARHGQPLAWFLGDVLIATTPGDYTPEQAGDALDMDKMLAAHRTWLGRSSGGQSR